MPGIQSSSSRAARERLHKTLLARDFVDELHHDSLGPFSRALNRARDSLPLSAIPAVAVWTLLTMLLPRHDRWLAMNIYLAGLFLILAASLLLVLAAVVLNRRRIDDAVLGRIACHIDGLAYHPNAVLKQQLVQQGYVTQEQLLAWVKQQRAILDIRTRDLRARLSAAPAQPDLSVHGDGARQFLAS
jgi:hypothetical protein